jgi:RNA polymerase sigma-70 factor (ECF subfamily)
MNAREHLWAEAMRAERRGDAAAYQTLLREVAATLRLVVRSRLVRTGASGDEAEDIVQEILISLHTVRHRWDPERPFMPWLYAIVRYKLTDAARRRRRDGDRRVDLSFEDWCNLAEAPPDGGQASPHDIDRALNGLPAMQRDVVRAVAVHGASVRDTAGELRTSEGAVRMTLHRAFGRLSKAAQDQSATGGVK